MTRKSKRQDNWIILGTAFAINALIPGIFWWFQVYFGNSRYILMKYILITSSMVITITHSNLDATRQAGLLYTLWRLATWPAAPACWGCRIIDSNNFSLLHIHAWSDPNDDFSHLNWKRGRGRISAISIIEIDFCNFIERFGCSSFYPLLFVKDES